MRARAWTVILVLIVVAVVILTMSRVSPSKPVAKAAEPGITHLEDYEIGRGMLYVIQNNVSGQLFGLYDIPGRDPIIEPLGEATVR